MSIGLTMVSFYKFHGTGNDFILLDGRKATASLTSEGIAALCHRHFGVGADGLIIISPKEGFDFEMIYFNSDGSPANMCGNGARCATAFASMLGIIGNEGKFLAGDGPHSANVDKISNSEWQVEISMRDVAIPDVFGDNTEINTGTSHLVKIVPDVSEIDTISEGRKIRYSEKYAREGINVDWVSIGESQLNVRTYERGVENETLSCGTGVTACAMVASLATGKTEWNIVTPGGKLKVRFSTDASSFTNVTLQGPARFVFKGETILI